MNANAVTISPKFQVVIPLEVRTSLKLQPGQKLRVISLGDAIMLIPEINIREARGMLKGLGIDTHIEREFDRDI